jgi:hypothetical protein
MSTDELIESAKAVIGEGQTDDYTLAPTKHAGPQPFARS